MTSIQGFTKEDRTLTGLKELAEFLEVSKPTALKLKNSGRIPFIQIQRRLIFNSTEVLAGLKRPK